MENITQYIADLFLTNGIVIAVGAFVLGQIIKTINFIPDKYIPLIGGCLGALSGVFVPVLFPDVHWFIALVNGLALGWAATGGYETVTNLIRKGD